ncbi:M48 family metallopeptidase [Halovivax gelatinilyticus]|uniref:M48 family metallopeptidase n=1 Tax=Halovivax gelatinilyticus TaxID=2961597 RepID=UPI0020CA6E8A|nr:M48 family metalloprotease [Halovivax gelatinilyticus]
MDERLTIRLAVTLGLVLAIDLLLAVGLALVLEPWVAVVLARIGIETTAPSVAAVAVVVMAVLLVGQLRYTRQELLAETDATVAGPDDSALTDRVRRLAAQADMPTPTVAISRSPVPNSMAIGDLGSGTIVVSRGLVERLDDAELDAVLAHELVHLKNRDALVMTGATFVPALVADEYSPFDGLPSWVKPATAGTALLAAALLAGSFLDAPVVTPTGFVQFAVATVVTLVVAGLVLGVLAAALVGAAGSLSRYREYVADRDGAHLAGNPAALANALAGLSGDDRRPETDKRLTTQGLCLLPYGFDAPDQPSDADGRSVDFRSHPAVETRIARLREQAGRLETDRTR